MEFGTDAKKVLDKLNKDLKKALDILPEEDHLKDPFDYFPYDKETAKDISPKVGDPTITHYDYGSGKPLPIDDICDSEYTFSTPFDPIKLVLPDIEEINKKMFDSLVLTKKFKDKLNLEWETDYADRIFIVRDDKGKYYRFTQDLINNDFLCTKDDFDNRCYRLADTLFVIDSMSGWKKVYNYYKEIQILPIRQIQEYFLFKDDEFSTNLNKPKVIQFIDNFNIAANKTEVRLFRYSLNNFDEVNEYIKQRKKTNPNIKVVRVK